MRLDQLIYKLYERLGLTVSHPDEKTPEPRALPVPQEPEPTTVTDGHQEFEDLLGAIGAVASEPDQDTELARKDATISELQQMLGSLRGIGDELARTEQERLALQARVVELEQLEHSAAEEQAVLTLERKLAKRESVLLKERERHAATRAKLAERKRVAADRWHELRALKAENRRLRAELEQAK